MDNLSAEDDLGVQGRGGAAENLETRSVVLEKMEQYHRQEPGKIHGSHGALNQAGRKRRL